MKKFLAFFGVLLIICATSGLLPVIAIADSRATFNIVIEPGLLAATVRGQNGERLKSPSIRLDDERPSICSGSVKAGTLGTDAERLYMENPDATTDGWSLSLSAELPSRNIDQLNSDPVGDQCVFSDHGVVIVDPTKAALNTDCLRCSTHNIAIGSRQNSVDSGTPVTILQSGQKSEDIGRWFLTGIDVELYQNGSIASESGLVLTTAAI